MNFGPQIYEKIWQKSILFTEKLSTFCQLFLPDEDAIGRRGGLDQVDARKDVIDIESYLAGFTGSLRNPLTKNIDQGDP